MRHRIGIVARFDLRDWSVFVEALATLLVVKAALYALDFRRTVAWAGRARAVAEIDPSRRAVERIAWLVAGASLLVGLRCLPRSLALTRLLARRGVATTLRIGVRTVDSELRAHAWVEWQGVALNDDERSLQEFAVFDRLQDDVSGA